jgi:isopenicillin-N N-acyltransferase like protein
MTLPTHRSGEATPRARGEAFGRAQAAAVANTVHVYARMFAADAHELGAQVQLDDAAREEIAGIAAGAGVDELALRAVNARTEILAGQGLCECSVVGTGAVLAQNWDWHPDFAASTLVWVVEQPGGGWFATLTEAGLLAKIGLNSAGLGMCLNLLATSAAGRSTRRSRC